MKLTDPGAIDYSLAYQVIAAWHELVSAYSQVTYLISGDSTITVLKEGDSELQ